MKQKGEHSIWITIMRVLDLLIHNTPDTLMLKGIEWHKFYKVAKDWNKFFKRIYIWQPASSQWTYIYGTKGPININYSKCNPICDKNVLLWMLTTPFICSFFSARAIYIHIQIRHQKIWMGHQRSNYWCVCVHDS